MYVCVLMCERKKGEERKDWVRKREKRERKKEREVKKKDRVRN